MHTNDPYFLQPALDVINRTDANLYHKIANDNWDVTVVRSPMDVAKVARLISIPSAERLFADVEESNGITIALADAAPANWSWYGGTTWLNPFNIQEEAESVHVPVEQHAAMILVHEYAHRSGIVDEVPAYDEGIAFARKLGPGAADMVENESYKRRSHERDSDYANLPPELYVWEPLLGSLKGKLS